MPTNQQIINAFYTVFGPATYWARLLACQLGGIALRRGEAYTGPPLDELPLWGRERRALASLLQGVTPPPTPAPTPTPWEWGWRPGVALIGLHGRADGRLEHPDHALIGLLRAEAVKLLSSAAPDDSRRLVINEGRFVLVRLFANFAGRVVSPEDFASWVADDAARHYDNGVRYFEIHNEPNLEGEGWGRSWRTGAEFAAWWLRVRQALRGRMPEAKWGWPGLSPNGIPYPGRTDDRAFLETASAATNAADFICLHVYWTTAAELAADQSLATYRSLFPAKLLMVSEFSNPAAYVPAATRADQLFQFWQRWRTAPGVGAAFAFCLSASGGNFPAEVMREEGATLRLTPLGAEMDRLRGIIPFVRAITTQP